MTVQIAGWGQTATEAYLHCGKEKKKKGTLQIEVKIITIDYF